MIKMYIAGEEVVCNKEFTIKEEMLSTSSTILNNCYPKSWEQDHDYTSRFYYPKDYSKCLINRVEEEQTITKNGSSISFNDLINPTLQDIKVYGNTLQDGTPTPDNPISIQTITGEQIIQVINNNSITTYPLNLGSIELCKIGNYQDTIYKQNGNWYIRKVIDKVVLNGTESDVSIRGTGTNYWFYCFKNLNQNTPGEGNGYVLSNYYRANTVYTSNTNQGICVTRTSKEIRIRYGQEDTLSNFLNWVSTHNINVYYVMTTPIITQITDTTIINQLENISITKGNNYVTTENNTLPFNLDLTIYDSGTELLFAGMVKNTGNISLNPREPKYCALEILDFKDFLSTGEYLDFVISNKTVLEAIQMVVDAISQYGFILGNINILGGTDIIGAYSTQEKSAYDVFQYLADITGSRWTTRMIDENTVAIDFYDPTLMPQGIDIEYTKEWWEYNLVNDLKFSYGSRDYRNKQIMLSNQVYGGTDYSETILGDGYNKNFTTAENIGLVKAIYVNGTEVSFSTNVDKEMGIDTDFYYTPGQNVVSSNENQDSYSAGTQIIVTYTPLIKGREVIYNTDEVNRVNSQIGRKGVVARYEQRNDILYTEDLEKIGQSYIKYKGTAEVILTLTTQVDIYNVGEIVYFNAPIQDLAQDYMVKRKSTQIIATGDYSNVWYTYQLTSSFNSETAINWFDNQRNKVSGNISEGEYITRNIDIENTANIIWDNLTITEVTVTGDNLLNSPLDSPFIQ